VKRLDAAAIFALSISVGALVATATTGAGGKGRADAPPSSPVVIDASGREITPLDSVAGIGDKVGVILFGPASAEPESAWAAEPESPPLARQKGAASKKSNRPAPLPSGGCVNINTADEPALTALKGIGPALAARIAAYRKENGAFQKKEDLMKVKGIGPAKFAAAEGMICL
jgi:competence ComEA-like helix-hairpin-helix protein